jgi:hypothetical protein
MANYLRFERRIHDILVAAPNGDEANMTRYICETCGTQYAETEREPDRCVVCEDERQYVGWTGQGWTSHDALGATHTQRIEDQQGLTGFGMTPDFAINQRAILLPTDAGNILWECLPLVTDEAVAAIRALGGLDRIVISHPHFYSSMGEWSDAFGGVPITIHEADRQWIQRPHPSIEPWSGDAYALSAGVTLVRCGGHFPGSTALHWADGPRNGALFSGDALQVVRDRRHVSFMYSYPNIIPMRTSDVTAMRDRLAPYGFEDVFGYTWNLDIIGGGREAVDVSFDRYLAAVTG